MSFIEMIVVLAIILALMGFLDFTRWESWVIFLGAFAIGFALMFFIANVVSKGFTDFLFPSPQLQTDPKKERWLKKIEVLIEDEHLDMAERELDKLLKKYPKDKDVSKNLGDFYRNFGRHKEWVNEQRRFMSKVKLTREERCTAFNRIADVYLAKLDNPNGALFSLRQIIAEFPDSDQAQFAHSRIANLDLETENSDPDNPADETSA